MVPKEENQRELMNLTLNNYGLNKRIKEQKNKN